MTKISGFIIAKNEEAKISKALKSLAKICDEVVVVDTGSQDRTKEIAQKHGAIIYDFKWIDDFSAARNFALEQCTGEWVLYLDADDEMNDQDIQRLKIAISQAKPKTAGFWLKYEYRENQTQMIPRVFRRALNLKFRMPIHEYLSIPTNEIDNFEVQQDIVIKHTKTLEESDRSIKRNLQILQKSLQKNPKEDHLKFFLAREFFNLKNFKEARDVLEDLLSNHKPQEDKSFLYNILLYLGQTYYKLQDFEAALKYFQKAGETDTRFNEPLILRADILFLKNRNFVEARKLYEQALKTPYPQSNFPVNANFYWEYPKQQIHKINQLKKPVALICGYYGKMNIGDELILKSIIEGLQKNYRLIAVSHSPDLTRALHGIESVGHGHQWFDEAIKIASVVIIGGGGLFHDQGLEDSKTVDYYCEIIDKAVSMGKKSILLGVGVDKILLEKNRHRIKNSVPKCTQIWVRDNNSKQNLEECGIDSNQINTMPDLVFGLKINPNTKVTKNLLGINVCPSIKSGQKTFEETVNHTLPNFLMNKHNKNEFIFIPGSVEDLQSAENLIKNCKIEIPTFKPAFEKYFESYFKMIQQCEIIVATRYHLLILGLILNKPVYAISYSEKTQSLLENFSEFIREISDNRTPKIINKKKLHELQKQVWEVFMKI